MGGDCLNYGCVPSKALIAAGKQAHAMRSAAQFGIEPVEPDIDFPAVMRHVREVIAAIAPNDSVERFTALGVQVIKAEARFRDKRTVVAGDIEIRARRFVIATGSSPVVPPIEGLASVEFMTNETIFDLARPGHLIVIGGGPVGIELAQAFAASAPGSPVIEAAAPLGAADPELSGIVLEHRFAPKAWSSAKGRRSCASNSAASPGSGCHGDTRRRGRNRRDPYARGGRPTSPTSPGSASTRPASIATPKASRSAPCCAPAIAASMRSATSPDRCNSPMSPITMPRLCCAALLFRVPAKQKPLDVPWAIFTDPELAHVGLNEAEARREDSKVRILRWPYAENDRAQAERKIEGHIKLVVGRKGKILGVSIVGAGASEMINIWSLALSNGLGLRDMAA